jgi:hypothetical protein
MSSAVRPASDARESQLLRIRDCSAQTTDNSRLTIVAAHLRGRWFVQEMFVSLKTSKNKIVYARNAQKKVDSGQTTVLRFAKIARWAGCSETNQCR